MRPDKLLIVGGVAGGATAAARARRLDESAEIIMFERGDYISFANCGLPYYIGGTIHERDDLMVTTPEALRDRYRIDVRAREEVCSIDRVNRQVEVKRLSDGTVYKEDYDVLILSPGAEPVRPPIPGVGSERIFTLRNIPDTDRIKRYVDEKKPARAVVVGGGFIGLEMVENLVERGVLTTVVEMTDQVMAPLDPEMAGMIHTRLREKGVKLELENGVSGFIEEDGRLLVSTDKGEKLTADIVILAIGVRPENRLAVDAGLEIGSRGGIVTDLAMRTTDPNIFAVGDAVQVNDFVGGYPTMIPLAGPANKQGRIAADNALGRNSVFRGVQGTSIVKLFDRLAACTGMNEKSLKRSGISYMKSYTDGNSHATYYPGAEVMMIKLLFSPADGRLYGAQVVGGDGVDKRIDVLATAIRAKMSVFDLEELELAYAPPFSSAKDPVNLAGFHAANLLKGDVRCIYWETLQEPEHENTVLLDVREKDELVEDGEISGAVNIPINELRDNLDSLEKDKTYAVVCLAGLRSYVGYRILAAKGFDCYSLSGGFMLYPGADSMKR